MDAMTNGIDVIVVAVVVVAVVVGILIAARSTSLYDELGSGGFDLAPPPPSEPAHGPARDEDIRQMLEAKNARRAARGEAPLDVESELQRLTAGPVAVDPGLAEEIRQIVEAKSARRVARGEAPLDVEAETARRLKELGA